MGNRQLLFCGKEIVYLVEMFVKWWLIFEVFGEAKGVCENKLK